MDLPLDGAAAKRCRLWSGTAALHCTARPMLQSIHCTTTINIIPRG